MKKIFTLFFALAALTNFAAKAAGSSETYDGKLNVSMAGAPIATDQPATVVIEQTGDDGSCKFTLPNFSLQSMGLTLGDIVVENAKRVDSDGDGTLEISGEVADMALADGQIHAKVVLAGTETPAGAIDMNIDVTWTNTPGGQPIPIAVTFKGNKTTSGVTEAAANTANVYGLAGAVAIDGFNGVAEVYSADGRLVEAAQVYGHSEISLPAGLYIVRTAGAAKKVAVK